MMKNRLRRKDYGAFQVEEVINKKSDLNYWPSFVDVLSVLFLVTLIIYIFSLRPTLNTKPEIIIKPYEISFSEKDTLIIKYLVIDYEGDFDKDVKIVLNDLPKREIEVKENKIIIMPNGPNEKVNFKYNKQYNPYFLIKDKKGLKDSVFLPIIIKKFEPSRYQPKDEYLFEVKILDANFYIIDGKTYKDYNRIREKFKNNIEEAKNKGCRNAVKVIVGKKIQINNYLDAKKEFDRDFYTYVFKEQIYTV